MMRNINDAKIKAKGVMPETENEKRMKLPDTEQLNNTPAWKIIKAN